MMRIVIIGGSFAGLAAALACRENYPEATVSLFEAGKVLAYSPNSLKDVLAGNLVDLDQGATVDPELLAAQGICCYLESPVQAIQLEDQTITYRSADQVQQAAYDYLILAMGSQTYPRQLPADQTRGLIQTRDARSSRQSHALLDQADQVLVVGAGAIGIEMSARYRQLGKDVTLLEAGPHPAYKLFDAWLGRRLQDHLTQLGVRVHCQETYQDFKTGEAGVQVKTQRETYAADAVHFAISLAPQTDLIPDQIARNPDGTVWVDDYLQTSQPGIFACGDLIRLPFGPEEKATYLPLIGHAQQTGRLAALNLNKARYPLPVSQRTEALTLGQVVYFSGGISQVEADYLDLAYCLTQFDQGDLAIQILSDQGTGRLWGVQAALPDQAESQSLVAVLTTALQAGLTDQFLSLQANLYQGRQALVAPDWFQAINQHWRSRCQDLGEGGTKHAD
ncbi:MULTISPECIES: FAD/NAD(P)-binding oxidoreductase [unclassified Aerococcus]|uniref:NAD(P)/FAD-dependent oxidoreductase n=2 Tax=Aerococcaceae TaxID=186827 RepID=A0A5N1GIM6_9LACT|nr:MULTISPECIES: FAD/NAD(P)-binding oxidoreductase [unclassified Aerococcus]KAA9300815.1 NAD(P)/FAD-dependent oxidoreductase [Aerococcus sanguinicola]MDK6686741.1 FAD/NAD(P)-binding oxidoreductase [Aerococcus sp. UMB8623]